MPMLWRSGVRPQAQWGTTGLTEAIGMGHCPFQALRARRFLPSMVTGGLHSRTKVPFPGAFLWHTLGLSPTRPGGRTIHQA